MGISLSNPFWCCPCIHTFLISNFPDFCQSVGNTFFPLSSTKMVDSNEKNSGSIYKKRMGHFVRKLKTDLLHMLQLCLLGLVRLILMGLERAMQPVTNNFAE